VANHLLLDAKHAAEAADRIKSAFLATMSHELRTPLNSIIGFTGIILQGLAGPLNNEQHKQMSMVRDSARHLLALINDVLDISKIEAGELTLANEPINLLESVHKIYGLMSPLAERKALTFSLIVDPDLPIMIGDQRRFEQVLMNLINNAIKFTEVGKVTLEVHQAADQLEVTITDTGIGIKPEDLDQLFVAFRQIDSEISRKHEGTGLGLTICRSLVEMMGGRVAVSSVWQQGSVFRVILPLTGKPLLNNHQGAEKPV
jgi:signal transduction histidine kinase